MATRILIIDDDLDILSAYREILEPLGYQISTADNGEKGLALALSQSFDLILLDLYMPKTSGFRVLDLYREKRGNEVPILIQSGNTAEAHQSYALFLGATDFIPKPFDCDKMIEMVEHYCHPHTSEHKSEILGTKLKR